MIVDSFSGPVVDLKRGQRTSENVLSVLAKHPRVSTWDMSEEGWLRGCIADLERRGLIVEQPEGYPWHKFNLTDAGKEMLGSLSDSAANEAPVRQPDAERRPLEIKMRAFSPNDEYVILINDCPVGGILSREQASTIVDWMRDALAELTIAFV